MYVKGVSKEGVRVCTVEKERQQSPPVHKRVGYNHPCRVSNFQDEDTRRQLTALGFEYFNLNTHSILILKG
jgi:hypothetical protein